VTSATIDVLLVDDDGDVREALADCLTAAGYQVATCSNGLAALDWLRAAPRPPGLVLLDMMMPVMDGWQFREEQLAHPSLAAVPVVMLSARYDTPAHAGVEQLRKPIRARDLVAVVARYCGGGAG